MHTYILEREQIIHRPRAETFAFFSDAFNLERITPPFLKFHIVTPRPIKLGEGAVIDYELSLYGLRFRWRTLIEEWAPEERFVDSQLTGPYSLWRHTHTFEAMAPDRTLVRDRVLYRLPFGLIGRLAHWLFVRRSLEEVFDYRARMIAESLAAEEEEAEHRAIAAD